MWQARFPSEMSLVRSSPLSVTAQPFPAWDSDCWNEWLRWTGVLPLVSREIGPLRVRLRAVFNPSLQQAEPLIIQCGADWLRETACRWRSKFRPELRHGVPAAGPLARPSAASAGCRSA